MSSTLLFILPCGVRVEHVVPDAPAEKPLVFSDAGEQVARACITLDCPVNDGKLDRCPFRDAMRQLGAGLPELFQNMARRVRDAERVDPDGEGAPVCDRYLAIHHNFAQMSKIPDQTPDELVGKLKAWTPANDVPDFSGDLDGRPDRGEDFHAPRFSQIRPPAVNSPMKDPATSPAPAEMADSRVATPLQNARSGKTAQLPRNGLPPPKNAK